VFPTPRDAIDAVRRTYACSHGIQAESKVDYFGEQGRVRGNALFITAREERVRFDVFSPFGVTLSTMTSNGVRFALLDMNNKVFFEGPANACNARRFLHVPVPPHALVRLLIGEAPILVHTPGQASLEWSGGNFVLRVASKHEARQEVVFEPRPDDWSRPWQEQRVRVREVKVEQRGVELYRALLDGHRVARTAEPRVDPDGIDDDVPPSGPQCEAEVPMRLHFVSPTSDDDVIFSHEEVVHNPPLVSNVFSQRPPRGVSIRPSACVDR
jgi:hypothetical protein